MLVDAVRRSWHVSRTIRFLPALRRLECCYRDHPRLGDRTRRTTIRCGWARSRRWPSPRGRCRPSTAGQGGRPPRVEVLFLGLFGPNGPLPLHLTEYARDRLRQRAGDATFARFADIFHHRLLSLFYRAWADAQPTVQYDRPEADRFAKYVGALSRHGMPALRHRDAVPDYAKRYYAGLLPARPRIPDGLEAMLADFFRLPVRIEEFVGQWLGDPGRLPLSAGPDRQLGALGVTATIGSHVWDCQQKFRIVFGPLVAGRTSAAAARRREPASGWSTWSATTWATNWMGRAADPEAGAGAAGAAGSRGQPRLDTWLDPDGLPGDADDLVWNPQLDQDLVQTRGCPRSGGTARRTPQAQK